MKLYFATKDDLKEWNPVWKFMCIKGIIFFTFWQSFLIEVLNSAGVIKPVGDWTADDFAAGLSDFLITFEMVVFSVMHRYAFPHTDYLHYLQRQRRKGRRSRSGRPGAGDNGDALLLFDHDNNVANDDSGNLVDAEYEPPTVRQLDRPMSVSRALMGSVVPSETVSDIARMSLGEGIVGSDSRGRGRTGSDSAEVMMRMEEAERI